MFVLLKPATVAAPPSAIIALAAVSLAAAAACTTTAVHPAVAPHIEFYQPGGIVVPGAGDGVLTSTDGCIRFVQKTGAFAAQFRPGTIYSAADRAMVLPDGQKLRFGEPMRLVFEAPPNARSAIPECRGLRAMKVLRRK